MHMARLPELLSATHAGSTESGGGDVLDRVFQASNRGGGVVGGQEKPSVGARPTLDFLAERRTIGAYLNRSSSRPGTAAPLGRYSGGRDYFAPRAPSEAEYPDVGALVQDHKPAPLQRSNQVSLPNLRTLLQQGECGAQEEPQESPSVHNGKAENAEKAGKGKGATGAEQEVGEDPRRHVSANNVVEARSVPARSKFSDVYGRGRLLGTGSFSRVYEVSHRLTGESFVAKSVRTRSSDRARARIRRQTVACEIAACSRLAHPNICQFLEYYNGRSHAHLVFEKIDGADLFQFLQTCAPDMRIAEALAASLMADLLTALAHAHYNGVCHRDVKPENALLTVGGGGGGGGGTARLKLIDWGIAHVGKNRFDFRTREYCGTRDYMAPEIILRDGTAYDARKADVWSAGVCLNVMVYGCLPFNRDSRERVVAANGVHPLPAFPEPGPNVPRVSHHGRDILHRMLALEADERPSPSELLRHPWFDKGTQRI
jgi:tRNA A-37 threonylcarbamoyl transferase component Bud32